MGSGRAARGYQGSRQPPEARGLGAVPPALGGFCNFSIKIFMHSSAKINCFEAITHKLKAFKISLNVLNRTNEIQVL